MLAEMLNSFWCSPEFKTRMKLLTEETAHKKSQRTDKTTFYRTLTGDYFLPTDAGDDMIANTIISNQIFDEPIYDAAKRYIQKGTTVLDIGSNFGQMAVLFSKLTGDLGVVHAFEADDFVFSILTKNVAKNTTNIITHFCAVHNCSGQTLYFPVQDFKRFGSYGSYGIDYVNGKGRPVKSLMIDDIEFEKPVSFMKIDIQGGDLHDENRK